ncbi:MAG: glycosyltransferase family 9 protein [Acidobacteria bacterium]|nr:glycosyltransferase family 9 protein [Acidobacteriota bacterium]
MASDLIVIRLGAMGDIIHTLPAVASLKQSVPQSRLTWVIDEKWTLLLEGNPFVDEVLEFNRRQIGSVRELWRELRRQRRDAAVDFQGLVKSALIATASRAERVYGFDRAQVRERLAALAYSHTVKTAAVHVVDKNLELARAAGARAAVKSFHIPEGRKEGRLPREFVLANPLAGWRGKQWPLENYIELARRLRAQLGLELVLNGPVGIEAPPAVAHVSGIGGLIDATRRASAVVGIDSGPLHLAAALGKPGVAIFGPTDPARNGPYGESFGVLRSPRAVTSYKRREEIDESMRAITAEQVFEALRLRMHCAAGL